MKVVLEGRMKNKRISIGYRMFILSMIKNTISKYDEDYYNEMFFYEDKKTKKSKPFTFSVFFQEYKINKEYIDVNGSVKIVFSTPDLKLNMILFNGFMKMQEYGEFEKISVKIIKERKVEGNDAILKTLSPIYLKNSNGKAIELDDENYNKEFNYFANYILKCYRGYGLKQELSLVPMDMKKIVVKEEIAAFKKITNKKYIYLNCYYGIFYLSGDKEDLNLLKELGVGARRNSGFGAIDLI